MSAECSVCNENILSEESVSTPCGHVFHKNCILEWLRNSHTCPQCRRRVYPSELRRLYFNINLNATRVNLNTTANVVEISEKERIIDTFSQLNQDLLNENDRLENKWKDEKKKLLDEISTLKKRVNEGVFIEI